VEALDRLETLTPQPQPEDGVTYASKIDKAEARVDWTLPAAQVDRLIRGLSPFPGAWCLAGEERVKLLRSRLAEGSGAPGHVLHGFTIACGTGAIEVLEAQRDGKRPMPAAEVLPGEGAGDVELALFQHQRHLVADDIAHQAAQAAGDHAHDEHDGPACPLASAAATPAGTATASAQASSHRSVR
jgi:hypothetical protein